MKVRNVLNCLMFNSPATVVVYDKGITSAGLSKSEVEKQYGDYTILNIQSRCGSFYFVVCSNNY